MVCGRASEWADPLINYTLTIRAAELVVATYSKIAPYMAGSGPTWPPRLQLRPSSPTGGFEGAIA